MIDFASRISGAAMLALAALPIAALATASHAEPRAQVADITSLTPQGVATAKLDAIRTVQSQHAR